MRSATLPPDLAAVAREARHNGRAVAPPRTATILGLGHHLPPEVVPNGPIAERIGVDDAWIVKRTGHPLAPPRGRRRAPGRPRHVRRPQGAGATRASSPTTSTWSSSRR